MTTNILGISAFYHDSAAALLRDGDIVAAAQEERFTRRKHDARFPSEAAAFCLTEAGISARDLQAVAFYERPLVKWDRLIETFLGYAPRGFELFEEALPVWAQIKLQLPSRIRAALPGFSGDLYFVDHHESHAASAFLPSPFADAAILTLDAVGEWSTSSLGAGHGNDLALSHEQRFPHSLGMLYSAFTYYAGFRVNSGEYKLMGLAPYGKPRYVDLILDRLVKIMDDGSLWLDMSYFDYGRGLTMTSPRFHELFGGGPRAPEGIITAKEMDLAASVQVVCEEVVLRTARHLHAATGLANLVMAGGVALNCVANGRLLREGPFEKIWIQPAAGDAGGALGAALLVWHRELKQPRQPQLPDAQKGSLLGPSFANGDIGIFLDSMGATYERIADEAALLDRVARLIANEKVIGWFQGRMEFGPRALGCRSIIGDARSAKMQQKMNVSIKFRESFRPFAPCILREHSDEYFDMRADEESPYMLLVAPVRTEQRTSLTDDDRLKMEDPDLRVRVSVSRSTVPAITHVDYSARVQTVDAVRHGRYYRLMKQFFALTGCPVIVNTSFNIRGEPIVCSPEDAYRCFMATDMDCLVLEDHVLLKEDQRFSLIPDIDAYRKQYPVPSTSSLPSLAIGFRRAESRAFWMVVSATSVAALGLGATVLGSRAPWAWAVVGLVPALPGLIWPVWFELGIRAWNKGTRLTAAALRGYVLKIGYYLLFAAIGRTGSSLQLLRAQNEVSRWVPRNRDDPTVAHRGRLTVGGADPGSGGWGPGLVELLRSSGGAGKAWTVCLMPMLLLLLVLRDEDQEHQPPSSTYTLY